MSLRVEYQHKRLADLKEAAPKDPDIDIWRRVQAVRLRMQEAELNQETNGTISGTVKIVISDYEDCDR